MAAKPDAPTKITIRAGQIRDSLLGVCGKVLEAPGEAVPLELYNALRRHSGRGRHAEHASDGHARAVLAARLQADAKTHADADYNTSKTAAKTKTGTPPS